MTMAFRALVDRYQGKRYSSHRQLKFHKTYNYFYVEVFLVNYHVISVPYAKA